MELFRFGIAYPLLCVLRIILLALGLTVVGLYGLYLNRAANAHVGADPKWVYAVVVGALSSLTALLYLIPHIIRFAAVVAWDFCLFVLWIALFGLFGKLYINTNAMGDPDIQRMKNAVWVDLAAAVGWFISFCIALAYWWFYRDRHSRYTGRAKV